MESVNPDSDNPEFRSDNRCSSILVKSEDHNATVKRDEGSSVNANSSVKRDEMQSGLSGEDIKEISYKPEFDQMEIASFAVEISDQLGWRTLPLDFALHFLTMAH